MEVTEKIASVYSRLETSFRPHQQRQLDRRGFALLEDDQLHKLYRDQSESNSRLTPSSALNIPDSACDFKAYANMTTRQRLDSLWLTVEQIAEEPPEVSRNCIVKLHYIDVYMTLQNVCPCLSDLLYISGTEPDFRRLQKSIPHFLT